MKRTTSVAWLPFVAVACTAEAPELERSLAQIAAPLVIECNYDPANPTEKVDICHDTAKAVGGAATTPGPYRHIRTNENGCVHGHAGHPMDFTIPPCAVIPDRGNPCACAPEGTVIEKGALACCEGLQWVQNPGATSGVCLAVIDITPLGAPLCTTAFGCESELGMVGFAIRGLGGAALAITARIDLQGDGIEPEALWIQLDSAGAQTGSTDALALEGKGADYSLRMKGLPLGAHALEIEARWGCNRRTTAKSMVVVKDCTAPIAVCTDILTVTLDDKGVAAISVAAIDEGSTDNCGDPLTRAASPLTFACADIGSHTVELTVTDQAGNTNACAAEVQVQNKPKLACPAPISAICGELDNLDPSGLAALFGEATTSDACFPVVEELAPAVSLSECGWGNVKRRFRTVDGTGQPSGMTCEQVIVAPQEHEYELRFPEDIDIDIGAGREALEAGAQVGVNALGCDLLGVGVADQVFAVNGGDACYRVERTHQVLNWCEWDGQSEPVIVDRDADCDGLPGDEDVFLLARPDGVTYLDRDASESNDVPAAATSTCSGPNPAGYWTSSDMHEQIASRGFWQYTQHLEVHDDTAPVIEVAPYEPFCSYDNIKCTGHVSLALKVSEPGTPDDVSITVGIDVGNDGSIDRPGKISGGYPNYQANGEGLPLGTHRLHLRAEDGCGNVEVVQAVVAVLDCKPPVPVCINGLAVELQPVVGEEGLTGRTDMAVTDFLVSLADTECSPPVTHSIHRLGEVHGPNDKALTVTCADLGTLIVQVVSWDSAVNPLAIQPDGSVGGPNRDYCETYVLVQDNMFGLCEPQ